MKKEAYKELSKTPKGRHDLHIMMVDETKRFVDQLIENAPQQNKARLSEIRPLLFQKIEKLSISDLYDYFYNEQTSIRNKIVYLQELLKGTL